jgi:hypothetical protein
LDCHRRRVQQDPQVQQGLQVFEDLRGLLHLQAQLVKPDFLVIQDLLDPLVSLGLRVSLE